MLRTPHQVRGDKLKKTDGVRPYNTLVGTNTIGRP